MLFRSLIAYCLIQNQLNAALIIFLLAILTDLLDGYFARRHNLTTILGSHLDRWADKILAGSIIFALLWKYQYYGWMIIYALGVLAFLIGNIFFIKKRMHVSNIGKAMVWLQAMILMIMIYGYVNQFTIGLFSLSLVIPALGYIKRML